MTLIDQQILFSRSLGQLLVWAAGEGIAVTMGETWRTPEQIQWNVEHGLGIAHSLHPDRLAVDLLCFRKVANKWVWLRSGQEPEYARLATYWKGLNPDLAAWGGDFEKPDPGHYSLAWQGRK